MAVPTIISQLITLIYNIADTWYIGQTKNPYMVAATSLCLTVFMVLVALSNLFGVGGGSLVSRLLGSRREDEARRVASLSLVMAAGAAAVYGLVCFAFMDSLLRLLGASDNTIGYARQYLTLVVGVGSVPTVLSVTMGTLLRNVGYSRQAAVGLGFGGVLNMALDPLFMFVLLPDGFQVLGAAIATMLSNVAALIYFIVVYRRVRDKTILDLPRRIERVEPASLRAIFAVGVPAALGLLLFDLSNVILNRLTAGHGDLELAAIGIVLKVERLPLNVGIGIGLGMMPLVSYNYAAGNYDRMKGFFSAARLAGITVAACSVVLYRVFAPEIIAAFIDNADTVYYGTKFLQARCFATPFMFLSFHMVYFMQSVGRGKVAFWMAVIRQLMLNIPTLFLLNHFFGMDGIVWTQATADFLNVIVSYIIYSRVIRKIIE
jgi:putative MATE family efflux protein